MIRSPVSPESPEAKAGGRAFARIHGYEDGLEVAANQNREKSDLDPVVVLDSMQHITDTAGPPVDFTHGRWREAPQVIDTTPPQAMGDASLEPTLSNTVTRTATGTSRKDHDGAVVEKGTQEEEVKREPRRYCGVSLKVLLLILLLIVLLIAAVIGGAVGGTQARKNRTSAENNSSSPSPTTATSKSTSSPSPSPHVRFRLQTYEEKSFLGASQLYTEPGVFRPAFPIASYVWINSKQGDLQDPTPLLRCSFGFCANATLNGWRGASDAKRTGEEEGFKQDTNFIVIGCDLVYAEPDCRAHGFGEPEASKTVSTVPVMETVGSVGPDVSVGASTTGNGSGSGSGNASATAQVTSRTSASVKTTASSTRAEESRTGSEAPSRTQSG